MGFADSFKRKFLVFWNGNKTNTSNEITFIGDLSARNQSEEVDISTLSLNPGNKNSSDSIIILSYIGQVKSGWECIDCGAVNPFWKNCCLVCGLTQR